MSSALETCPSHATSANADSTKTEGRSIRSTGPDVHALRDSENSAQSRCPFLHSAPPNSGPVQSGPIPRCPVAHRTTDAPAAPDSQDAAANESVCPHASGANAASLASEAPHKPLVCPMGYGGGRIAPLAPLSCAICRSLYYDAAATACGHTFCRFCIQPFHDCPLCGADCQPLTQEAELQGAGGTRKGGNRWRVLDVVEGWVRDHLEGKRHA